MITEKTAEKISEWIAERVKSAGAKGVVVGLSGGLDSSVTAALCKRALGDNVLGLLMPCHSAPEDLKHAKAVAKKFRIKTETIDLTETYETILESLPEGDKISRANIKPRFRMLTLYYFANLKKYLVVGTGNKTETVVGYTSKYGDSAADILPLGDFYKTQVKELAVRLNIPGRIINKPPSAGLWPGQKDERELGITYEELDKILEALEKNNIGGFDPDKLKQVRDMIKESKHKREAPPVCKI